MTVLMVANIKRCHSKAGEMAQFLLCKRENLSSISRAIFFPFWRGIVTWTLTPNVGEVETDFGNPF